MLQTLLPTGQFMEQLGFSCSGETPAGKGGFGGTLGFNLGSCNTEQSSQRAPMRTNLCSSNLLSMVPVPPEPQIPRRAASGRRLVLVGAESLRGHAEQLLRCPQCPAEVALPSAPAATTGLGLLCGVGPCLSLCSISQLCDLFSSHSKSNSSPVLGWFFLFGWFFPPVVPISHLYHSALQASLLSHLCAGVCA